MSASFLRTPQQITSKLELVTTDDADGLLGTDITPARTFSSELQVKFRERFSRYLRGVGHPPATSPYANIVTDAMRNSPGALDPLFRAKLLLRLSTGGAFIPQARAWKLKVSSMLFIRCDYQLSTGHIDPLHRPFANQASKCTCRKLSGHLCSCKFHTYCISSKENSFM